MRVALISAALLLALGACSPDAEPPPASDPTPLPGVEAPATRPDTLWIEGNAEPIVARRYSAGAGFPLPFWTYLPPDWQAGTASSGEGDAVRITPVGPLEDEVMLTVAVYPEGTTAADARERAREAAEQEARRNRQVAVVSEEPADPWALVEIVFAGGDLAGRVLLGEHAGRYFEVHSRYPIEAGDGFGPRAHFVLDAWRWADTGAPLGGEAAQAESRSQP